MSPKRKILFILHLPPPIHGPAVIGRFIKNSEYINKQFDIDYVNLQTSRKLKQIGKGWLDKLSIFLKLYYNVLKALTRNRYDFCYITINAHGPAFYKEMIIVFFLKLFGLRPIYYYHMKGISKFHDKWLEDKLYNFQFKKSRTILLSPHIYFDIAKYVPKERVFYCIQGVPDTATKTSEALLRQRAKRQVPQLLFLSNLLVAKGVWILLEACKILHRKGYEFRTTLIGGAIEITENDLIAYIDANNLEEKVIYVGPKYGPDKVEFFERTDIFIHPTLNDVLPLTILEAMQFSIPVIATHEGAIAEMVEDGVNGYIVPKNDAQAVADKIAHLLDKPGLRSEMSYNARERFEERFTLRKFEKNFVNALNQAMNHFDGLDEGNRNKVAASQTG